MLTVEDQNRVIELSDAANRALCAGSTVLAERLTAEAEKLLDGDTRQSFVGWAGARRLNLDTSHPGIPYFSSKHTQELFDCWLAARGEKVWMPK